MKKEEQEIDEEKEQKEYIDRLTSINYRISEEKPMEITARGHKFVVRFPQRMVSNKIDRVAMCLDRKGKKVKGTVNADAKVASLILLHNPIKIFFFHRIHTWYMKYKYNSEVFSAIIETGKDNKDLDFFSKNSISLISQAQAKIQMMLRA